MSSSVSAATGSGVPPAGAGTPPDAAARGRAAPPAQDLPAAAPGAQALAEVRALVDAAADGRRADLLLDYLHRLDDHWGGLHTAHLAALAAEMELPPSHVFDVANACGRFEVLYEGEQPAPLTVRVCDGLACRLAGAPALLRRLPEVLVPEVRVCAVPCLGRCDQAPAVLLGQVAIPRATEGEVVNTLVAEVGLADGQVGMARDTFDGLGFDAYRARGGYSLAAALAGGQQDPEDLLRRLEDAGLPGCAGTDTLAARQWRELRAQPDPRVLAVGVGEGGPCTFQDREALAADPHRFLEGVLVAAALSGARAVFISLRADYHDLRVLLEAELAKLRARPPCQLPRIDLRRGTGGGAAAMVDAIEGCCGEPRPRAGAAAPARMFGCPVAVHDFEAMFRVREVAEGGGAWLRAPGRRGHRGTLRLAVSGRVRRPGVVVAPAGISLRELIEEHCGGMPDDTELLAWLPGGHAGGILPASLADLPLDAGTLEPHGATLGTALVVLARPDRARDAALHILRQLARERGGACGPCRGGAARLVRLMEAPRWNFAVLEDMHRTMAASCTCGQSAAMCDPARSVRLHFPHEAA